MISKNKLDLLFTQWNLQRGYDDIDWRDLQAEILPELVDIIKNDRISDIKKSAKRSLEWLNSEECWTNNLDGLNGADLAEAAIAHFIAELIGDADYKKHLQGWNF
jgi:hypothetical protein